MSIGSLWRRVTGRPLATDEAAKEQITPIEGLPALSLDALTSVAYGPEAIALVLATAGAGALHLMVPVTGAIVVLLAILVFSYCQVIDAYPGGGGAYAVSKENLGAGASQLAAAALIVDYVLTVAVSIAAGVGALTSAFTGLHHFTVEICLIVLAVITVLNLRGLGEGARAFLGPTIAFIVGLGAVIVVGFVHPLNAHGPRPGVPVVATHDLATVGVLLLLRAFAAGCSALTGVEAIANGVPLFKEPRVARAKQTEVLLGTILGVSLLGLAELAVRLHIEPRTGQTLLSLIAAAALGRNWAFFAFSVVTVVVLALAANTSFGGLPVLTSLLARDNYVPHFLGIRGDRLVYANGIWTLAGLSAFLMVVVRGNTQTLIPLFAIGVFTGFTLSQTGLVVHWHRERPPGWVRRAAINATGAVATAVATVVFVVTKFTAGGWVVVVTVPLLIVLFHRVRAYYDEVRTETALQPEAQDAPTEQVLVVVPVSGISQIVADTLRHARSLSTDVVAVTVRFEDDTGPPLADAWQRWGPGVELVTLVSRYHSIVRPLTRYVDGACATGRTLVVVLIPVIAPRRFVHRLLHNQLDLALANALRRRPNVIVARLPFQLKD
ncbi:MAG TPA: APC family permease [Acidimicrobiales bacterium]|nr:APC family permease [Acidimicrobiales bacterium]